MGVRVEHVYFIYKGHQLLDQARELQLMADEKYQHRQSIRRILIECTEQHRSKEDQIYLKEKNEEVQDVRQYLTTSLHLLNSAQDGLSNSDTEDNVRVTGLQYTNQNQVSRMKSRMTRLSDQSRKTHFNSVLSQRKSSSFRSELQKSRSKKPKSSTKLAHDRLSLPSLMNKVKMSKKPANASKNSALELSDNRKLKVDQDVTYAHIRSERRKVEELRHLTVLGRVMGENYKKHLKKLEERKKLFLRNKVHSQY